MLSIQDALNQLAGTSGRTAQDAINIFAGTSGLTIHEAVRYITGYTHGSIQEMLNRYLGTVDQSIQYSFNNFLSRYFLAEPGAGSGVHNRIVFDNSFNTRALNLVRASTQGGVITNAAQTGLNFTGDFTVESYIKLTSNTDSMDLLTKWLGTGNQRSYIVRLSPASNLVELYVSPDGTAVTSASISYTFPTAGTSFHIAVGYDASAGLMKLEINGVLINTATGTLATSIFNSTADVTVGYLTGGTNAFNGVLDHYRVWGEYRSTADILANMNVSIVTDAANLKANWKFNGNLLDSTTNNNDLTAFNAPTYVAPLFGSNIYLSGDFTIAWQGFLGDQEEGTYGICGADEEVTYGQIKVVNNTIVIKTETDQTGSDVIDFSAINVEDSDTGLHTFILSRNSSNVITLYLDDTAVGNTATVAGVLNIQQFLGSPEDTADLGYFGGMKGFRVWSAELSAGDRTTIDTGGHVTTSCEYYANTNIASGTTVSDLSGNGRTGTLANAGANFFFSYIGENLFTYAGFNDWAGAFPNEVPTGWSESYSQTATNYLTESVGKLRIVSDGTNIGINKASVLTTGQNYRVAFYVSDITSGNVYVFQESGNTSLLVNPFTVAVGWNVWEFTTGATTNISFLRVSGAPNDDVTIAYALLVKR